MTLMVGARAYPLSETDAIELAAELEARHRAEGHRVAKAIPVTLEDLSSEPLELGQSQIEPVRDVLEAELAGKSPRLLALRDALRRWQEN